MRDTSEKWNTYEITADGNRLIAKVNGRTTVDVRDDKLTSGTVVLQAFS